MSKAAFSTKDLFQPLWTKRYTQKSLALKKETNQQAIPAWEVIFKNTVVPRIATLILSGLIVAMQKHH